MVTGQVWQPSDRHAASGSGFQMGCRESAGSGITERQRFSCRWTQIQPSRKRGLSKMNFATKAAQRMASPSRHDLVLLGPVQTPVPSAFTGRRAGSGLHKDLLSRMQRFRGATYLKDGAITAQSLDAEGRHCTDADWHSWHILAVDEKGDVRGCSRYTSYRNPIDFGEL